jgi:dienelactone hydrolase
MSRSGWPVLLLAACMPDGGALPDRAAPAPDSTGFVVMAGADTVLVERYVSAGDTARGTVRVGVGLAAFVYEATGVAGRLTRFRASVIPPAAPLGAPARTIDVRLDGDSARLRIQTPQGTRTRTIRGTRGARVYLPPSIGLLQHALGGARRAPVLVVPVGGVDSVEVRQAGEREAMRFTLDGEEWRLELDSGGRVVGGRNVARGWTIARTAAPDDRALATRPNRFTAPPGVARYGAPAGAPYTAREVRVATPAGHALAGTLTVPGGARGRVPAVLLISGSSAHDRDMAEADAPYRPFAQLADTLGRRGIAVLRLDDRGVGASGGRFEGSTTGDRADDMRAALAFLRARPEVDPARVALFGLSEGGQIAPMLAAEDARLRGIVLLGAPGTSGRAVALYQTRERVRADPRVLPARRDSAVDAQMRDWLGRAATEPWIDFFVRHDPLAVARRVRTPVLIVHGTADRNVPPESPDSLRAAFAAAGNGDVTVRVLAGVNHAGYRDADGGPRGEMYVHSLDVAPEVMAAVIEWLVARLGAQEPAPPASPSAPARATPGPAR